MQHLLIKFDFAMTAVIFVLFSKDQYQSPSSANESSFVFSDFNYYQWQWLQPTLLLFTNHIINPLKVLADSPVLESMWPAEDLTWQCLTGSCLYSDPFPSVFLMLTLLWLHVHHFCLWVFASLTWFATFKIKTYCLELHTSVNLL